MPKSPPGAPGVPRAFALGFAAVLLFVLSYACASSGDGLQRAWVGHGYQQDVKASTGEAPAGEAAAGEAPEPGLPRETQEAIVLEEVNRYRVEHDRPPVAPDPASCSIADERLRQVQRDFSHEGFSDAVPDGTWGENLARGYGSEDLDDLVRHWASSKSHRRNLLYDFSNVCVRGERGYWVMIGRS